MPRNIQKSPALDTLRESHRKQIKSPQEKHQRWELADSALDVEASCRGVKFQAILAWPASQH